ncbi:MAG TPA: glycosyltransferase [Pyrinomonadaceae bacterium]|nr:glycosyltransferase [Pyrinomonadaceae bacterium]
MKIALCKSHFFGPVSGADEILVSYAISLHNAGHDVDVVLLYKPTENDRFNRRLRQAGVPVVTVINRSIAFTILRSLRGLLSSFLLFFLLVPRTERGLRKIWQVLIDLISRVHYKNCRAYFAQSHYDVLHVFTPDTGATLIIRAGKEAGIPVLYHEMGTPHYLPPLDPHYKRLEKVLPLCSEVAALSPTLARQWSERFPFLSSVSVLPLITDDSDMLRMPVKLGVNGKNETIFGFAARIETGKGPFVLADALAQLRASRDDVLVRLAGTGPAVQEVKAHVRELRLNGSWEFVGSYDGAVGVARSCARSTCLCCRRLLRERRRALSKRWRMRCQSSRQTLAARRICSRRMLVFSFRRATAPRLLKRCNVSRPIRRFDYVWARRRESVI